VTTLQRSTGSYVNARLTDEAMPATVNRELAGLRRMFSLTVQAGKLPSRPHIAMLAEDNARQGFMEPAVKETKEPLGSVLGVLAFLQPLAWHRQPSV